MALMKFVMSHSFSQVPKADIPRLMFNCIYGYKTTFNAGDLIPFYVDEALPGDTFNLNVILLARLNTPIYPIMDNMVLDTFYFAISIRLIWDNFQKMMGEQTDPGDSTDFTVPVVNSPAGGFAYSGLEDYFGIPPQAGGAGTTVAAFWHRAYNLTFNEWFRDQNLIDSVTVNRDDGPDASTDYAILKRGKRHDYFTSALSWPQKGPGVELPFGSSAPIVTIGADVEVTGGGLTDANIAYVGGVGSNLFLSGTSIFDNLAWGTETGLEADLSSATVVIINLFRQAFQMQKLLERDARGGTRYAEIIKSHYGVTDPMSAVLQRPQYFGGGSTQVNFQQIAAIVELSDYPNNPLGELGVYAVAQSIKNGFIKSFTEHCVILGLCNVRADLIYQQGIPRMFSRSTRFDFFWPALAYFGEQAVLNKEIYHDPAAGTDDDVFGYQERWAEYRYYPSKITAQMRSTNPLSLDAWHLFQEFGSLPILSETFIQEDPPINRVVAVSGQPDFKLDCFIQNITARAMPTYSVPGLIDHF